MAVDCLAEAIVTTILRVFLRESWPVEPRAPWVLLDAMGQVLQEGASDALHWPASDHCEAVLSAPQVSCLRSEIPPRVSKRDLPQVVAGVLETSLLDDMDQCHLTLARRGRTTVDVMVVNRTRLRNIVSQFEALNRPLGAAYSQVQTGESPSSGWLAILTESYVLVRRAGDIPLVFDVAAERVVPKTLVVSYRSTRARRRQLPITIWPESGRTTDIADWKAQLGANEATLRADYHWYQLDPEAVDLLHGQFGSSHRRSGVWSVVRPAVLVAAIAIAAYVAVGFFQIGLRHFRINQAERHMSELFQATFKNVPIIVPAVQALQQLDHVRAENGLMRSDDLLVMLGDLADALASDGIDSVQEIKYENRSLRVVFQTRLAPRLESVQRQMAVRGYAAAANMSSGGEPSLTLHRKATQ